MKDKMSKYRHVDNLNSFVILGIQIIKLNKLLEAEPPKMQSTRDIPIMLVCLCERSELENKKYSCSTKCERCTTPISYGHPRENGDPSLIIPGSPSSRG